MILAQPARMKFLGIGESLDLGDLYLRLLARGHEVRVRVSDTAAADILVGFVSRTETTLEEDLAWVGKLNNQGMILFEGIGHGELQSLLRLQGYTVVGGSSMGDRLEKDRAHGQRVLRDLGVGTAAMYEIRGFSEAIAHVARTPKRYVLKFSGGGYASTRTYVGMLENGSDMVAILQQQQRQWAFPEEPVLVLMEHLQGVEVGVGAWFNGHEFLRPANLDWEHKRFFPGDLGELTGEMGTVVSYENASALFEATLARTEEIFRQAGHVGYVNLNLIVNAQGIWPLEFTCRFGYPGFAILSVLQAEPWDLTLLRLTEKSSAWLPTHEGFAVGIVLTVPPFPYADGYARLSKGMPICFAPELSDVQREAMHFGEVGMKDGQLVTAGEFGYTMVTTGKGASVAEAQRAAYAVAKMVAIPNIRYRNDIGDKLINVDQKTLQTLGWLP